MASLPPGYAGQSKRKPSPKFMTLTSPPRHVHHTVQSTCRMGFGAAIFGKLNLPTGKSKHCFSWYDSLRKRNIEGRQTGEVKITQTCKLHVCPVHSAPGREKHSNSSNMDMET